MHYWVVQWPFPRQHMAKQLIAVAAVENAFLLSLRSLRDALNQLWRGGVWEQGKGDADLARSHM